MKEIYMAIIDEIKATTTYDPPTFAIIKTIWYCGMFVYFFGFEILVFLFKFTPQKSPIF
jgi:hypothetical protein